MIHRHKRNLIIGIILFFAPMYPACLYSISSGIGSIVESLSEPEETTSKSIDRMLEEAMMEVEDINMSFGIGSTIIGICMIFTPIGLYLIITAGIELNRQPRFSDLTPKNKDNLPTLSEMAKKHGIASMPTLHNK